MATAGDGTTATDTAVFYGSGGNERYYGRASYSYLTDYVSYYIYGSGFDTAHAHVDQYNPETGGAVGGTFDFAFL